MSHDRDLFGLPVDPHHGQRGRPRHLPTPEMRRAVRELRAQGVTRFSIATALGISQPTLRLHYRRELETTSPQARKRK